MSRIFELVWAFIFSILAVFCYKTGAPSSLWVAIISLSLTLVMVVLEVRKPSYHGIFWQKFNPDLPNWFNNNAQSFKWQAWVNS